MKLWLIAMRLQGFAYLALALLVAVINLNRFMIKPGTGLSSIQGFACNNSEPRVAKMHEDVNQKAILYHQTLTFGRN